MYFAVQGHYGSYEEMLKDPNVDLVYICTPNAFHYEQIKLCFSFGKFYANSSMKEFQAEAVRNPEFKCDFGMDTDIFYENGV